ncbi:SpoIIE family protein phosphatase (plasmid) [Streptoverticillium reticulum]|uniref:SpoIIE family protein phosphatase n=1 Tax=Streptoverticillium reticulum TaxID=1433415 RepID=UPI0039BEDA5F
MARFRGRSVTFLGRRFAGGKQHGSRDRWQRERRVPSGASSVLRRLVTGSRSLAGQVFALQVLIILLLVIVAVGTLVFQADSDRWEAARTRALAASAAFARGPGMASALRAPDPSAILQPLAESARSVGRVDFIVVMNREGIRYTHPQPGQIGQTFVGSLGPALAGRVIVQTVARAPGGEAVQAIVPVMDSRGTVVGVVSAGLTISRVSSAVGRKLPLLLGAGAGALVLSSVGTALVSRRLRRQTHGMGPVEMTRMYEHHDAVLHAVREGVVIVGEGGRVLLVNDEACRLLGLPADTEGRRLGELGLDPRVADLLASQRAADDEVVAVGDRLLAVNFRSTSGLGRPSGGVATLRDFTELRALAGRVEAARGRLELLYDASVAIGTTLDVQRTAEELTQVVVPRFADYASVDLAELVLRGEEPQMVEGDTGPHLCRVALDAVRDDHPLCQVGAVHRFAMTAAQARLLASGRAVLVADPAGVADWCVHSEGRSQALLGAGFHSFIAAPLKARGALMGVATFWRTRDSTPFEEDDLSLAEELTARAAVCVDNARRFTREHTMAVTLQRSLLPGGLPEQEAVDFAYRYLPAHAGVGGDWFDVIPLSGARVALVIGDVVGRGLHAAATMGRLRTAVQNFATLDPPPEELLAHLDGVVARIDRETSAADGNTAIAGATCLIAMYDPVSGICSLARAGHPPPALVHADGTMHFPELPGGPPLGLGGMPFESVELLLPEGSSVVLYTKGLTEGRTRDMAAGLRLLGGVLNHAVRMPEETCDALLETLLPASQTSDIALLVARTRRLEATRIATWEVLPDPSAVAGVRADVTQQLSRWGLDEAAFTTELILSELVTNAIRYASAPIRVRLLRTRNLICEVSDASSTAPHLRYAADEDEGGRGLFLVAQLADRWGTRYTREGKVIWAEQAVTQ